MHGGHSALPVRQRSRRRDPLLEPASGESERDAKRSTHGDGALRELGEAAWSSSSRSSLTSPSRCCWISGSTPFDGDTISRMANGFYVIHSRDPHLGAIGFVWNPLSSLADLPLLSLNSLWPSLASHDVAGTTMSALAMACATYQLARHPPRMEDRPATAAWC